MEVLASLHTLPSVATEFSVSQGALIGNQFLFCSNSRFIREELGLGTDYLDPPIQVFS